MGRKDIRVIPWKYVTTLQFVISASAVNLSVIPTQYIIPFSPYFAKKTTGLDWDQIGYVSGALVGSYVLGRAIATPFWLYLADLCGRRAVLSMCFMFSLVLTMFFGLCSTFITAVIVRFCLGLFAPVFSLSHSLLRELSSPCMEKLSTVSMVTGLNAVVSTAAGLFIGAFMVPDSETGESMDEEHKFSFLSCSLISAAVTLFAFIAFFVDFPETLPIAAELKKKAIKASAKPTTKGLPGKYVELTETGGGGGVDEIKQETKGDVVTERKEQEEEEELPGYLVQFQMQGEEKSEEERGTEEEEAGKKGGDRFFSPRNTTVSKVFLNPRPNTTRATTVSSAIPDPDEPKEPISQHKSQLPSDPKSSEKEEIKRTHISFFEEDFNPADVTTTQFPQSLGESSLDDMFSRKGNVPLWKNGAFRSAIGIYIAILVLSLSTKEANIVWLVADSPRISLPIELLGVILIVSTTTSQCAAIYFGSKIVAKNPLNHFSVSACFLLALITLVLPYPDWIPQKGLKVVVCVGVITTFEVVYNVLATVLILRISDSVGPADRESALRWCSGLSSFAKTFSVFLGPSLLSASFTSAIPIDYHFIYAVASCGLLLCSGFLLWTRSSFPRFDHCPYEI